MSYESIAKVLAGVYPPRNAHGGHHGHRTPHSSLAPFLRRTREPRAWKRRPTTAQALALRSRIILRCSEGKTNTVVAGEIGLAKQTVGKWRARFIERRLDGLLDEPRPGGPRSITDTDVERVVTLTLETRKRVGG